MGKVSVLPQSKLLTLRGGMDLGPLDADNVGGFLKVAAAVTAASAVTEKYAGLGETAVTKLFKGDVWTNNLIIAMVTGVASTVVYSVGGSAFDAAQLGAVLQAQGLWLRRDDAQGRPGRDRHRAHLRRLRLRLDAVLERYKGLRSEAGRGLCVGQAPPLVRLCAAAETGRH